VTFFLLIFWILDFFCTPYFLKKINNLGNSRGFLLLDQSEISSAAVFAAVFTKVPQYLPQFLPKSAAVIGPKVPQYSWSPVYKADALLIHFILFELFV